MKRNQPKPRERTRWAWLNGRELIVSEKVTSRANMEILRCDDDEIIRVKIIEEPPKRKAKR